MEPESEGLERAEETELVVVPLLSFPSSEGLVVVVFSLNREFMSSVRLKGE